jgi:UDP:flavonoid glycosyltransferase YjiC (YdhE family)
MAGAAKILAQIRAAYGNADAFLRITPAMPMVDLTNVRGIEPIAKVGINRRAEINAKLGLAQHEKLVLVSMGGMALRLPMERWPQMEGVRWLVQADWQVARPDVTTLESLQMEFIDLLASCDALLCKPGYGSFAEAACNGVPVLYVAREDWPEEPYLIGWLEAHGLCRKVQRQALERGAFEAELRALLAQPQPKQVKPLGIQQAADYLLRSISIASP